MNEIDVLSKLFNNITNKIFEISAVARKTLKNSQFQEFEKIIDELKKLYEDEQKCLAKLKAI